MDLKGVISRNVEPFVVNLLAGLLIFFFAFYWRSIRPYLTLEHWRFAQLFGRRTLKDGLVRVVLDTLERPIIVGVSTSTPAPSGDAPDFEDERARKDGAWVEQRAPVAPFVKRFPDGHQTALSGPSVVVPQASARAAAYLGSGLRVGGVRIDADADLVLASKREGCFICLGGSYSNIWTDQVKHLPENRWLEEDGKEFRLKVVGASPLRLEDRSDKAIILKLDNPHSAGYSVWVCEGLGEWGTAGAAWYLARHWKRLWWRFGRRPFMIVLSVTPGSDESAREIRSFSSPSWWDRVAAVIGLRRRSSEATMGAASGDLPE